MADESPITLALFWSKVSIPLTRVDCWEWTSTTNENGYGRFYHDAKWRAAHRYAYALVHGPIPEGLVVRHRCHNRLCCNPDHLVAGTSKDNAQDALAAGRFSQGEVNGNSKLTPAAVVEIRRNRDRLKTKDLAKRFNVSAGTISNVRTGKIWRHVAE